jgi:uncharacterized protein DUF2336
MMNQGRSIYSVARLSSFRREAGWSGVSGHFMRPVCESLIAELEWAVKDDLLENRIKTLRRVTDLFLNDAERLNDDQIKVFDDVLCLLIRKIEGKALVELSRRLAPIDNSPIEAIRHLARDQDIEVAGPVLTQSRRLHTSDLIDIAATMGQAHLLAISGRQQLDESVTDVILSRGDEEVVFKLATNSGARFSQTGYGILVKDAEPTTGWRKAWRFGSTFRRAFCTSSCSGRPRRSAREFFCSRRRRRARRSNG